MTLALQPDIGVRIILSVVGCFFYFGAIYGIHETIFGWCNGNGCEHWKHLKESPPIIEFTLCTFGFIIGSVFIYWTIIL